MVFFSVLSALIMIVLYLVFLGDAWKSDFTLPEIDQLMNHWLIAGITSTTSITTTMGAFGIMVEDRVRKNSKDFLSAPLKRSSLVSGYLISAFSIGVLMSLLTFLAGEAYILIIGGTLLSFSAFVQMILTILLTVLMSGTLVFFIVSFFSSTGAFTTASTILGVLVGFLTGIYLPIGNLPNAVQWVIKLFPLSHSTALMRQIMMEQPIQTSFQGIPETYLTEFKEFTGVIYRFGDTTATTMTHVLVLLGTAVLFFLLTIWRIGKKKV